MRGGGEEMPYYPFKFLLLVMLAPKGCCVCKRVSSLFETPDVPSDGNTDNLVLANGHASTSMFCAWSDISKRLWSSASNPPRLLQRFPFLRIQVPLDKNYDTQIRPGKESGDFLRKISLRRMWCSFKQVELFLAMGLDRTNLRDEEQEGGKLQWEIKAAFMQGYSIYDPWDLGNTPFCGKTKH